MIENAKFSSNEILRSVLDTAVLQDELIEDSKCAFLESFRAERSTDQKPWFRLLLSDVSGITVVGRAFNVVNTEEFSNLLTGNVGKYVLVNFSTDFYMGELGLIINSLRAINSNMQQQLQNTIKTNCFGEQTGVLRELSQTLNQLKANHPDIAPFIPMASVDAFSGYRSKDIGNGKTGALAGVVYTLNRLCDSMQLRALDVMPLITALYCKVTADANNVTFEDIAKMSFYHIICDRAAAIQSQSPAGAKFATGMMHYATLLCGEAINVTPTELLVFDLYQALCQHETTQSIMKGVPPSGSRPYGKYTLRKE